MRRLIWGFASPTYHIVENLISLLKCCSMQNAIHNKKDILIMWLVHTLEGVWGYSKVGVSGPQVVTRCGWKWFQSISKTKMSSWDSQFNTISCFISSKNQIKLVAPSCKHVCFGIHLVMPLTIAPNSYLILFRLHNPQTGLVSWR